MSSTLEEFDRIFMYHEPDEAQIAKFKTIRAKAHDLALYMEDNVTACREKSLAFTKLQEAVMWANAAIARRWEDQ